MMTRGRGGVWLSPENDDVIYEQPLMNIISQLLTIGQKKQWKSFFKFCHISDLEQVV